jgi:invasion protein IalB
MYNDVDDRRRYEDGDRRPRSEDADDGRARYDEGDDGRGRYAEDDDGRGRYDDVDSRQGYDEPPERRSRLVPILTIVAALLAIAIGVVVVLYVIGVFDRKTTPQTGTATEDSTPIDLTPEASDAAPTVRAVGGAEGAIGEAPATAENPDVPQAVVSIAPPAQGEPPVRSTHGDWQVRCDTPAGAQSEQCVLMQFVTAEDRENVGLTVIVLKTADQKARIMRILAPLGVLLPSGLGLKIDDADIGRAGFVRCLPNGCVAEVILEDALLGQLQNGKTATFIIFQTPEEGIGIPISLAGFGPGFATLP